MEHILKTIADIESKISEHEREIIKYRSTVNSLCVMAGMEPKYDISAEPLAGVASRGTLNVKPDQYYGKPLSTAVREVLNMLRAAERAPASVETIYDYLCEGGYHFDAKSRDAGIQSLSISIGKNSALFVKLKNGLIGVTDWYESTPRARRKKRNGESDAEADSIMEEQEQPENETATQPTEGGAS